MPVDLSVIVPLVVSVLGALGIGSVIGQWAAGGKDRRTARAEVLTKLGNVELKRWTSSNNEPAMYQLWIAVRELEMAALIARLPRAALTPYIQLAVAGLATMLDEAEDRGFDYAGLSSETASTITDAADIVSRAAWSTTGTRWWWMRRAIAANRREVDNLSDERFNRHLAQARRGVQ